MILVLLYIEMSRGLTRGAVIGFIVIYWFGFHCMYTHHTKRAWYWYLYVHQTQIAIIQFIVYDVTNVIQYLKKVFYHLNGLLSNDVVKLMKAMTNMIIEMTSIGRLFIYGFLFKEKVLFPLYRTSQYLETIVVDLNYLIVMMFDVLVLDNLFGPYVKQI